jgi:hypothetical protein
LRSACGWRRRSATFTRPARKSAPGRGVRGEPKSHVRGRRPVASGRGVLGSVVVLAHQMPVRYQRAVDLNVPLTRSTTQRFGRGANPFPLSSGLRLTTTSMPNSAPWMTWQPGAALRRHARLHELPPRRSVPPRCRTGHGLPGVHLSARAAAQPDP